MPRPPTAQQNTPAVANFTLPAGVKRSAETANLGDRSDDDSSSSEESYDSEFVPPPRARAPGGGLRETVPAPPAPYWDDEAHREACRAELQELAGAGASWSDVDASEGDSDCDIESDDDDEDEEEEAEVTQEDPPQL